ncbi:MAG: methyltransferase domain-containing protein [Chloroflexi bacterium]|nr:methyltransferase domain-containing protein [Chloroflexota bacterium]
MVDSEILSYYQRIDEANRLARGGGHFEFARMQDLIRRFLPPPPGVVLDVGGGPGRYSFWLAEEGYDVHLIDPVDKHVRQARQASASQAGHPLASATEGDARSLSHSDGSADAVLLMGPLYHLTARDDRLSALREAHRVLKPGGLLVAKAINRFASLLDGLREGFIDDPNFVPILHHDLKDGQHRGHPGGPGYFTTAFFHRPEELEAEVLEMEFDQPGLYAVQGPGLMVTDLEARMSDPGKRAQLLDLIRSVEQETTLLGVSTHFVVVATK